jgi:predicted transcriptional regulator
MKLNKNDEQVIAALKESKELTMQEISDKTGVPSKKVFKSLRKLFENEMIGSKARKYRLLTDKPPAAKAKEDEAPTEEE